MATHWGWYWKVKLNHKPKKSCSHSDLYKIDSFEMYKSYLIEGVLQSVDRLSFAIPKYNLRAYLQDDCSLFVLWQGGSYTIAVEQKPCNFGGYYYFFNCPKCSTRMRKLYCLDGKYLCRKCANLAYYTQRLLILSDSVLVSELY